MAEGVNHIAARKASLGLRVLERGEAPLSEWADEDLMLAQGQGAEEAFAELLRRHERGVLNYMFRMLHNRHIAEELCQEVFLALVQNGQRYRPTAKFTTYLYTIASNIVRKEWSRQKRRSRFFTQISTWWSGEEEDAFDPLERVGDERACVLTAFQRGEVSEAVNAALNHLPDHQREVFVLHRFQELGYEEMSEILDVPEGTLKSRMVRAERALRPYLEKFREYL